jgi:hydroxymethylbilane synthase
VIRIGTRGSRLARVQTDLVAALLAERGLASETQVVQTEGDQSTQPLREIEGKGFFTKELDAALLEGRIDLAVHSLKDLPTEQVAGLAIAAVLPRANPLDALIVRPAARGSEEPLRRGAVVGTTSLRRRSQLLAAFPEVVVEDVRGNVPTRIEKLRAGAYDALVLAQAGLDRLAFDLSEFLVEPLTPPRFLPAPGQGAIAIVSRRGDADTEAAVHPLNDESTDRAVRAERRVLAALEGGCHLPLGTLAILEEGGIWLRASLQRGARIVRADTRAPDAAGAAHAVLRQFEVVLGKDGGS